VDCLGCQAEERHAQGQIVKVKDMLLGVAFWASPESMVELFQPIVKLLRLTDSELPSMSKVQEFVAPRMFIV
jgi:hypothetical protein